MTTPKVSVLVPTYNYARYLPEAIESVLEQDFQDFEMLIGDDCSTDGSREVIARYAAKDSRIRFQIHPTNLGMVRNWNWCLSNARGEYIKFLFGDDKLASRQTLTKLLALLETNPSVALAASARYVVGERSEVLETWDDFRKPGVHCGTEVIVRCLEQDRNLIGEPSVVLFRRPDAARGFDLRYQQIVDLEMWFHLLEKGGFAYTREPLCCFRKHSQQQTELNRAGQTGEREAVRLLVEYHMKPYLGSNRLRARRFSTLYKLRKQRKREAHMPQLLLEMERDLSAHMSRSWYAVYWSRRRITQPFLNFQRWIKRHWYKVARGAMSDEGQTKETPTIAQEASVPLAEPAAGVIGPDASTPQAAVCGLVFSKDRPLQLDIMLRSFARHCADAPAPRLQVLFAATNSRQHSFYRQLVREHPAVTFIPERNFRRDVLTLLQDWGQVLFLADDYVFIRKFDVAELSRSLYHVADLLPFLGKQDFKDPSSLAAKLASRVGGIREAPSFLLCPPESLACRFAVGKTWRGDPNRAGSNGDDSLDRLAGRFAEGWRVQIATLDGSTPTAGVREVELPLVPGASPVPLVSVIVPVSQPSNSLREAVATVAAQTFTDWEMILVSNAGMDFSSRAAVGEMMKEFAGRTLRWVEAAGGGRAQAWNAGMRAAHGAYLLPLDGDYTLEPTMLENGVGLLDADPDLALAYTDLVPFGEANQPLQSPEYNPALVGASNRVSYCSLFRYEVWEETGGYDANLSRGFEAWDFWVNCAAKDLRAKRIPGPLVSSRGQETSSSAQAAARELQLRARIVWKHPEVYDAESQQRAEAILATSPLVLPPGAPKVSVIVPTFNRPGPLLEALRSILDQTCQDFEIIVVNDAGLDVGELVTALAPPGQITYLRHTRNQDRAAARNTALRAARGKYVAYLDDDDLFYPDHLESLITLAESGGHQVVYSDAYRAVQKREGAGNYTVVRDLPHSSDFDYDQILVNNQIPLLCVLHERACAHQVGLFDESLGTHEDWDYWIRMSRRFRFAHLKKVTCEFRWCEDGSTTSSARRADFLRTTSIIHDRYKRHAAGNPLILKGQQVMMQALRHELALLPAEERETPRVKPGAEETPWSKRPRMKMAFLADPAVLDKAPGELQESA